MNIKKLLTMVLLFVIHRLFKCISIHRLINGIYDCPDQDDENMTAINHMGFLKNLDKTHFKCEIINIYIPKHTDHSST